MALVVGPVGDADSLNFLGSCIEVVLRSPAERDSGSIQGNLKEADWIERAVFEHV